MGDGVLMFVCVVVCDVVQVVGFRVWVLCFRELGLRFRVWGFGFRGLGFRVLGFRV